MSIAELKLMLIREIDRLSPEGLSELVAYVKKIKDQPQQKPQRKIGALKGTLLYMATDFNDPLEDFKDYM